MSMRSDMFSADVIDKLRTLQNEAPPHSFATTRRQLESIYKKPVEEVFEYIT